jgi:hypothetical protein
MALSFMSVTGAILVLVVFPVSLVLVWSKNSSSLAVSKKFKYFNADEFIEGTSF